MIPYFIQEFLEQSLEEIGIDAYRTRGKKDGQWSFKYKNSDVWIDIYSYPEKPDNYYFQVMSPLCKMIDDKNNENDFLIDLLEFNYNMYNCAICKKEQWFYVLHLREVNNIQKPEIDNAIDRVAFYSADCWSKLSFKYKNAWKKKE
jgi:hypothetical protein